MSMISRVGRIGIGMRMGNPSAVDAMRMVKERRTARISYKQDKQPDGRYLFYCPRHVHRFALLVWVSWLPHNPKIPVSIRLQSKNIHLDYTIPTIGYMSFVDCMR